MESRRGEEGLALLAVLLLSNLVSLLLLSLSRETRVVKTQRDKVSSSNSFLSSNLFCCASLSLSLRQDVKLVRSGVVACERGRSGLGARGAGANGPPKEGFFAFSLSLLCISLSRRPDNDDDEGSRQSSSAPGPLQSFYRSFLAAVASAISPRDSPGSGKTARDASITALKERRGKEKSTNEMMHRLPPPPRPHRKASESAEGPLEGGTPDP